MSHTTTIRDAEYRSPSALRKAVDFLNRTTNQGNLTLREGGMPRMWYANQFRTENKGKEADYTLLIDGCRFDVGFVRDAQGNLTPVFDDHGGYVRKHIGNKDVKGAKGSLAKLTQAYQVEAAKEAAEAEGYTLGETKWLEDGTIQAEVVSY